VGFYAAFLGSGSRLRLSLVSDGVMKIRVSSSDIDSHAFAVVIVVVVVALHPETVVSSTVRKTAQR